MRRAPFAPLLPGAAGLQAPGDAPEALWRRMADLYDVRLAQILVVRGALHAVEIVMRLISRSGSNAIIAPETDELQKLAAIYGLTMGEASSSTGAVFAPMNDDREARLSQARSAAPVLFVVDESDIEFSEIESLAAATGEIDNLIVIRSLELAYGLAGAPCAAVIAAPGLIERLGAFREPNATPPVISAAALAALDPMRMAATREKIAVVKSERARLAAALSRAPLIETAQEMDGPAVCVTPLDSGGFAGFLRRWKIDGEPLGDGAFRLPIRSGADNDRILAAFNVDAPSGGVRHGEVVRETKETRIAATVDLDREGVIEIDTGVGYFDHMLAQIAQHGGISVTLACAGDLEVDAHHTIEDCAIAFGGALSQALGDRRGVARFGFLLPMDEAEARVSVDLGGRPYLVFNGEFSAPLIGAYPTEMTEHVFRSLSQSLGAAIHISVTGENDHHKTEACFKAFGRALRQAIRIENDLTPSTKGVIL